MEVIFLYHVFLFYFEVPYLKMATFLVLSYSLNLTSVGNEICSLSGNSCEFISGSQHCYLFLKVLTDCPFNREAFKKKIMCNLWKGLFSVIISDVEQGLFFFGRVWLWGDRKPVIQGQSWNFAQNLIFMEILSSTSVIMLEFIIPIKCYHPDNYCILWE